MDIDPATLHDRPAVLNLLSSSLVTIPFRFTPEARVMSWRPRSTRKKVLLLVLVPVRSGLYLFTVSITRRRRDQSGVYEVAIRTKRVAPHLWVHRRPAPTGCGAG